MALLETRFDAQTLDLSVGMQLIMPDHPDAWQSEPALLYLLHGLSDDHTIWTRRTSIERYAARYPLIIVMPDIYKSFYCNMAHGSRYWDFISDELPAIVKRFFNVTSDPKKTFVAGLSMGGYGAFKLALNFPDRFSHAASLSGALDIASHIHDDFNASRTATFNAVFGDLETLPGSDNDLLHLLSKLTHPPATRFYTTCGTDDYLYQDTLNFNQAARNANLDLTTLEAPGDHKWGFWDHHIQNILEWLPIERLESQLDYSGE
jgi:putative tributyrin esterase